jgi:opacity protein-like surface antigen
MTFSALASGLVTFSRSERIWLETGSEGPGPDTIEGMKRLYLFPRLLFVLTIVLVPLAVTAQTDVAASVYRSFPGSVAGNGIVESPVNAAGVLLELRHISNPLVGYELNYSFNNADRKYNLQNVTAHASQVGADCFVSVPLQNFKPFILAGGGLMFFSPAGNQVGGNSQVKPVFVYGAGVDWTVIPHLGLRFQYRGNLYRAPDLLHGVPSTDKLARDAQPIVGAYFRF